MKSETFRIVLVEYKKLGLQKILSNFSNSWIFDSLSVFERQNFDGKWFHLNDND